MTEKSPLETGRTCSLFGLCGGCTYLSLPYEEQLKVKEEQVKRLLDSVLNKQEEAWAFEGIKGSPKAYEYRNKMEFSFGDEYKDGPLALGMHKRGSFYDIVTVADCEIVDADYRLILQTVRDYFAREKVSFFHRMSHEGYLRHLLVRKASRTGEILVALVTTSQDPWQGETAVEGSLDVDALITGFKDLLLSLEQDRKLAGKFAGILHITNDSIADVVQSDRTELLYGQEYFYEELLGLKFKISTFSFFQTNSYSAEVLYQTARDYVGDLGGSDKTVFDLYSGTGTIAQLMAPAAGKVIGVEIVEEAVEAAKKKCRCQRTGQLRIHRWRCTEGSGRSGREAGYDHPGSPQRRHPPQGTAEDHCLRRGSYCLHLLQTHQPCAGSGSVSGERLPRGQGRGRGPVPLDRKCRDGCSFVPTKTR